MQSRHRFIGIGSIVFLLFVFGASQLQAQGEITLEGLASRVSALTRRVTSLSTGKVDRKEFQRLQLRVATAEAKLETLQPRSTNTPTRLRPTATQTRPRPTATQTRPRPTATQTRPRPTATYTRVRPTSTPVPTVPYVTITRPMNLRSGPGTNYPIVQVAEVRDIFDITGRNAQGTWWRIDVEGENAWVYAAYVTATNADRIRSVPTPLPPRPTPQPTATPRPQTSQISSGEEAYAYAAALVFFDQMSMGTLDEWTNSPDSQKNRAVQISASLLIQLTRWCALSTEEMADLVGEFGKVLDDTGYTARTGLPVRQLLMYFMSEFAEENPIRTASCEELFEVGAMSLLESE